MRKVVASGDLRMEDVFAGIDDAAVAASLCERREEPGRTGRRGAVLADLARKWPAPRRRST